MQIRDYRLVTHPASPEELLSKARSYKRKWWKEKGSVERAKSLLVVRILSWTLNKLFGAR